MSVLPLWKLPPYFPKLNHFAFCSRGHDGYCTSRVHNFHRGCRIQWFMPCNYVLPLWLIPATKTIFIYAWTIRHGPGRLGLDVNADRNQVILYIYLRSAHQPPCSSALVRISSSDECEKWRKTIEENQPFLANPCRSGWGDFTSGPSLATKEHCSKERKEYVAGVSRLASLPPSHDQRNENFILVFEFWHPPL